MSSHTPNAPKYTQAAPASRLKSLLIGAGALALVLGGYWYYANHKAPAQQARRETAAPVRAGKVERRDMAVIERTIGTVVANSSVQVTARVQGHMNQAFFKEGQLVKKGQLLFQLDARPYQAALDRAEANLVASEAKYKRYQTLADSNAISQLTYDDAHAAYLQAKADVDTARLNLEYTRIVSPVNGKTGAILVQPGNFVTATAGTGSSALVTITEIQPIKISFALPQADLPRIQARARANALTAQIKLHDAGGLDLNAAVDFVNNAVAGTSGTIEMRASVPNTDAALVPGQLVDVVVELDTLRNAIVVPRDGINTGPEGAFVYLIAPDMTAQERPVKVLFDDGVFAAVTGNIEPGDRVVTNGQLRVVPGGKVRIEAERNGNGRNGAGRGGNGGRGEGRGRGGRSDG
jgi:multidrug efflux system membrane fusion protein